METNFGLESHGKKSKDEQLLIFCQISDLNI